jgi:hypothetical protein
VAARVRAVGATPSASQTRFFREADRVAAEALHARLMDLAPGRTTASSASDFGFHRPAPSPGLVELWIAPR